MENAFLTHFYCLYLLSRRKITKILSFAALSRKEADSSVQNFRRICEKNSVYSNFRINSHTSPHNIRLSTKTKNSTKTNSRRSCRATTRRCRRAARGISQTASVTRKPRASTRKRTRGSPNSSRAKMCGAIGLPTNSCLCLQTMKR